MAALWFSPENSFGHLESADANGSTDTGFYSSKNLYFHCLLYLDSSSADKQVPLLTLLGGSSPAPTGLRLSAGTGQWHHPGRRLLQRCRTANRLSYGSHPH